MDLSTVLLFILTTARIVIPGVPSKHTGTDGKEYIVPPPSTRDLSISLANSTNAKGRANVYLPEGIRSGNVVRLLADNIQPEAKEEESQVPNVVIKNYWGSGLEIPEGQPLLAQTKGMALELQNLPKGSLSYWPDLSKKNPPEPRTAVGKYGLSTDYCGSAIFSIPQSQDFLPPIDMNDIPARPDPKEHINLSWKAVPGAVAYFILAQGGNDNETITWSSSATSDYPDGLDVQAVTAKEIESMLKNNVLMPATQTSCNIPAGIFKNADTFVVTMVALGQDRIENVNGISVRVVRRSLLSIPFSNAKSWK